LSREELENKNPKSHKTWEKDPSINVEDGSYFLHNKGEITPEGHFFIDKFTA